MPYLFFPDIWGANCWHGQSRRHKSRSGDNYGYGYKRKVFGRHLRQRQRPLYRGDMKLAKEISAAVLRDEKIGFISDAKVRGNMPDCLIRCEDI